MLNIRISKNRIFKIKELRLKAFDEKASSIDELIKQTEKLIDDEAIFIANIQDISIKETINEVRRGLKASAHGLNFYQGSNYRLS